MKLLTDLAQFEGLKTERDLLLLYLSRPGCMVCEAVRPKLSALLQEYSVLDCYHYDLEQSPTIAGVFDAFSLPVVLLFVQGRETLRMARHISLVQLRDTLNRYQSLLELDSQPKR